MENPYKIKRPSDVDTGQLQEKELITIKDDSVKLPPTVGTPSWMSIMMGPAVGQPGNDIKTFEHSESTKRRYWFPLRFWLLIIVVAIIGYFAYAFFKD